MRSDPDHLGGISPDPTGIQPNSHAVICFTRLYVIAYCKKMDRFIEITSTNFQKTSKNRDARKSFMIDTRNQLQSLKNVIDEQSNNNELNMAQKTASNPKNDPTMTAEKSAEKLPSSTDLPDNNFISSNVDNCINNSRRSEKQNAKNYLSKLQKDY